MVRYLIGIDDTDSAKSPTTGDLVRRLAESLVVERSVEPQSVTRHQLLAKKKIPYTAHNSAVCLSVDTLDVEGVWETVRDFLILESARHSNAALCLSRWDSVSREVMEWGRRAKAEVVAAEEARQAASRSRVRVAALLGDGSGVIGALAAIGLHRDGNDGRFLWLPGLFALEGSRTVAEILELSAVDRVCTLEGSELSISERVDIGSWARPVLRNGLATLYVQEGKRGWAVLDKERTRELSN